ncbi:MAG: hypothetical protein IT180_17495 [Acidobacteria bacterium]|nr:hypothetical protein [Acidobacteriota bacterium]
MIRLRFACSSHASLIVVGGHSRGVGKTSVVEHILRSRPEDETWAAVKVSAHRHAPASGAGPLVEETLRPSPLTQSGRYLASGARRAFLCRTPDADLPETAAFVRGLLAEGTHVIVESNRLASFVEPDVLLFVVSPSVFDWKPSSGPCLARADALVTGERAAAVPKAIAARGVKLDGRPVFEMTRDRVVRGLDAWVDGRLNQPIRRHAIA